MKFIFCIAIAFLLVRLSIQQLSESPSMEPTAPTESPTVELTNEDFISYIPTMEPTDAPTSPTLAPIFPTLSPTWAPSEEPTAPTGIPTAIPSSQPTDAPTSDPTAQPSSNPTDEPSSQPTQPPTNTPSAQPTLNPTSPTSQPSISPSSQPSTQPSNTPSAQPTSWPTALPTPLPTTPSPTVKPGYNITEPVNYHWIYSNKMDTPAYTAIFSLCGTFVFFWLITFAFDGGIYARRIIAYINYIMFNLFNYSILCLRFGYLLAHSDWYYPAYTQNGRLFWPGPEYNTASEMTLDNTGGCPVALSDTSIPVVLDYDDVRNKNECRFLMFGFPMTLVQSNEAKFSVGLGLMIYFIILATIFYIEVQIDIYNYQYNDNNAADDNVNIAANNNVNGPVPVPRFCFIRTDRLKKVYDVFHEYSFNHWFKYVITGFLGSQQYCILMILTNLQVNPYCAYFESPTTQRDSVCYYEKAIYALPYMGIFTAAFIGSLWVSGIGERMEETAENNNQKCTGTVVKCIGYGGAVFCAFCFVCFLVYYLFAGFGIGLWFTFGAFDASARFFTLEYLAISIMILNDYVHNCFNVLPNNNNNGNNNYLPPVNIAGTDTHHTYEMTNNNNGQYNDTAV